MALRWQLNTRPGKHPAHRLLGLGVTSISAPHWILTDLAIQHSSPFEIITTTTDLEANLHLLLSPPNPTYSQRYKITRGISIPCGYTVSWPTAQCIDPDDPGPSTTHTWIIPSTATPTPTMLAFSECCPPVPGCPGTPPFQVELGGPNDPTYFIELAQTINQDNLPLDCLPTLWQEEMDRETWPEITLPTDEITFPRDGLYEIEAEIWWQGSASGQRQLLVEAPGEEAQVWDYMPAVDVDNGTPIMIHGFHWQLAGSTQTFNIHHSAATTQHTISATPTRNGRLLIALRQLGTRNT